MRLSDLTDALGLEVTVGSVVGIDVEGAYASDLLSDAIAHAGKNTVWITIQVHQNIIAVAVLKELAAVVITGGRKPNEDTREKAESEGIPILTTRMAAFDVAGRMYEMGLRSGHSGDDV